MEPPQVSSDFIFSGPWPTPEVQGLHKKRLPPSRWQGCLTPSGVFTPARPEIQLSAISGTSPRTLIPFEACQMHQANLKVSNLYPPPSLEWWLLQSPPSEEVSEGERKGQAAIKNEEPGPQNQSPAGRSDQLIVTFPL